MPDNKYVQIQHFLKKQISEKTYNLIIDSTETKKSYVSFTVTEKVEMVEKRDLESLSNLKRFHFDSKSWDVEEKEVIAEMIEKKTKIITIKYNPTKSYGAYINLAKIFKCHFYFHSSETLPNQSSSASLVAKQAAMDIMKELYGKKDKYTRMPVEKGTSFLGILDLLKLPTNGKAEAFKLSTPRMNDVVLKIIPTNNTILPTKLKK